LVTPVGNDDITVVVAFGDDELLMDVGGDTPGGL
jgi:hypothetical protein